MGEPAPHRPLMNGPRPGRPLPPLRKVAGASILGAVCTGLLTQCGSSATTDLPTAAVQTLPQGEICTTPEPSRVSVRVHPERLVLAPGQQRSVRVVVEPDVCAPLAVRAMSADPTLVPTPTSSQVDYASPTAALIVTANAIGSTTLTVTVARGDGTDATTELPVEIADDAPMVCSATDDVPPTMLAAGARLSGIGSLQGAGIELPTGADRPNEGGFVWSVSPFEAAVSCAPDIVPAGYRALGPAVRFAPEALRLPRDLPLTVPINPARFPQAAGWQHVQLAYTGPAVPRAQVVPASDLTVERLDEGWVVRAAVPRLGTYQAVVRQSAGSRPFARRLSHRAVIGISMGAAGAAQLGLRRHELFDVVAPLGGPMDWTWLAHHLEQNHLGGFRPIESGTTVEQLPLERQSCASGAACASDEVCLGAATTPPRTGRCTLLPSANEPYLHASTFDTFWYESEGDGNGGAFSRRNYAQLFRDIALGFGNIAGFNPLPGAENLPAGVDPDGQSQTGDHAGDECKVWVDPIADDEGYERQQAIADSCPAERCQYVQTFAGYYDDEYNPDGAFPVITFCDGSPQDATLSPYASTWSANGNDYPIETLVAVDYNGNGVRDELEPVIRAGHERWYDWGDDAVPSALEAGYGPSNLDPEGDDYDPQYNPAGTEGDHRWQPTEPFDDFGLDGVPDTANSPFDHGEGDGEFTVAPGLQALWELDGHSAVRGWTTAWPAGPLDDAALRRIDLWTDGGIRDLFNFAVAAQHLTGTFAARGRDVAYYGGFARLPGLDPSAPPSARAGQVWWDDVPGAVLMRYGATDPTAEDIASGSGQHVGTADEAVRRLQWALYYTGSRWPDASRAQVEPSADNPDPDADDCEVAGTCELDFTASFGRTGPAIVSLPPGYANLARKNERFPVAYVLHGYGQTPDDLKPVVGLLSAWMNDPADGQASRLPRMIVVYVDGRCREQDQRPECIRGTFYADSPRAGGALVESWWLELMDHIDSRFRTMGESTVEWTD